MCAQTNFSIALSNLVGLYVDINVHLVYVMVGG